MINKIWNRLSYGSKYLHLRVLGVKWLFVIGHMRSGSSLLVHILNTNPEIIGYGETHLGYFGRHSLARLHEHVVDSFTANGEELGEYRFVMDKILHPHIGSLETLKVPSLKMIVIVRDPVQALPSILDLDLASIQTGEEALEYYCSTLRRVDKWRKVYSRPHLVVDYSEIVKNSEPTLNKISKYLDLERPLKCEYETTWATGEPGYGDPSEQIELGKINEKTKSYDSEVKPGILFEAQNHYRKFLNDRI